MSHKFKVELDISEYYLEEYTRVAKAYGTTVEEIMIARLEGSIHEEKGE